MSSPVFVHKTAVHGVCQPKSADFRDCKAVEKDVQNAAEITVGYHLSP
jgi:hypothetical protein